MPFDSQTGRLASKKRWANVSPLERRRWGKWMMGRKASLHTARVLSERGHCTFLRLCQRYKRELGRKLTPADHAEIRKKHADEIAASAKPYWR